MSIVHWSSKEQALYCDGLYQTITDGITHRHEGLRKIRTFLDGGDSVGIGFVGCPLTAEAIINRLIECKKDRPEASWKELLSKFSMLKQLSSKEESWAQLLIVLPTQEETVAILESDVARPIFFDSSENVTIGDAQTCFLIESVIKMFDITFKEIIGNVFRIGSLPLSLPIYRWKQGEVSIRKVEITVVQLTKEKS